MTPRDRRLAKLQEMRLWLIGLYAEVKSAEVRRQINETQAMISKIRVALGYGRSWATRADNQ